MLLTERTVAEVGMEEISYLLTDASNPHLSLYIIQKIHT